MHFSSFFEGGEKSKRERRVKTADFSLTDFYIFLVVLLSLRKRLREKQKDRESERCSSVYFPRKTPKLTKKEDLTLMGVEEESSRKKK